MTAVNRYEYPDASAVPVKLEEGAITRADVELPDGTIVEDAITARASGIVKGDYVAFYSDQNSGGEVVMTKVTLGSNEVNNVHGVVIDSPIGEDNTTATSGTPAHAQRRRATVMMFGHRMTMMDVTSAGALRAGYSALFSESAAGIIEGSATLANGDAVIAAYTAASGEAPVLLGYYGFHPAD
jgi:hypothetical protein